jgi:hypothetical protein
MEDLELELRGDRLHFRNYPEGTHTGALTDGNLVRRVADMTLHVQDLSFARRSLAAIEQGTEDEHIRQALWHSAIVHFFKCFQSSDSRPCKLNAEAVFKDHPPWAMANYRYFDGLRNKHIVHDENSFSQCLVAALVNDGGKAYKIEKVVTLMIHTVSLTSEMLINMRMMTDTVLDYVEKQCDMLTEKISAELEERTLDELRALPALKPQAANPEDVHKPR